jgi:hypothetical protein
MPSGSNTSDGIRYIAITRMDQEVMSRIILVDFTVLDVQNAILTASEMKDFIATLAGVPQSQVKYPIAQLKDQVITQTTIIVEVRERNSAHMNGARDLVENKTTLDNELA